jgi:hypothetical protein
MTQELIRFPSRTALLLILSFVLIGLYGCEPFTPHEQEAMSRAPSRVVVLTTAGPLTYQRDSNGQSWGIDAELLTAVSLRATRWSIKFKTYRYSGRGHGGLFPRRGRRCGGPPADIDPRRRHALWARPSRNRT